MDYSAKCESLIELSADCAVLGMYQKRELTEAGSALDQRLGGLISRLLKRDDIEGKVGDLLLINHVPEGEIERILVVGLGKKGELGPAAYRKALAAAAKSLKDSGA